MLVDRQALKTIWEKFDGNVRAIVPLFDQEVRGAPMLRQAADFYNRQLIKAAVFLVGGLVLSGLLGRAVPSDPLALLSAPPGSNLILLLCLLLAIWI